MQRQSLVAQAPCWSEELQGSPFTDKVSLKERKKQRACLWVCISLPMVKSIFFSLKWTKVTMNSLPFYFSLPLFAQVFNFLASPTSCFQIHSSATNFRLYFCQSFNFLIISPTHLSILLYLSLYIFSFSPPSFRLVNLRLYCSNPIFYFPHPQDFFLFLSFILPCPSPWLLWTYL